MPTTIKVTDQGGIDLRGGRGPLLVGGAEAAKSFLIARFAVNRGDWKFNLEFGPAYNAAILGKFFDEPTGAGLLAAEAGAPNGIAPVPASSVVFSFDPALRKLSALISPVYLTTGESFDLVVPVS